MKLTAQTTTTKPIATAMAVRPGTRPAEVSMCTLSGQPFFAHGQLLDALKLRRKADARPIRHANRPLRGNRYFRLDDVLMPIAPARRHVTRQNEIGQRGKRDVVRAPDPRF